MTGLWAFEVQMPYQKYQGPPIVVKWIISYLKCYNWHRICFLLFGWGKFNLSIYEISIYQIFSKKNVSLFDEKVFKQVLDQECTEIEKELCISSNPKTNSETQFWNYKSPIFPNRNKFYKFYNFYKINFLVIVFFLQTMRLHWW